MLAPAQNMRSLALVDDHGADLGMLEADAVQRVVQLDIDAEIVGIELELVAGDRPPSSATSSASVATGPSKASRQWRYCFGFVSKRISGGLSKMNYNADLTIVKNYYAIPGAKLSYPSGELAPGDRDRGSPPLPWRSSDRWPGRR